MLTKLFPLWRLRVENKRSEVDRECFWTIRGHKNAIVVLLTMYVFILLYTKKTCPAKQLDHLGSNNCSRKRVMARRKYRFKLPNGIAVTAAASS